MQPGTGRIHINDVGQDSWEEIDVGAAGANYGWPYSEGPNDILAGFRPHRAAVHLSAQRSRPARLGPRRLHRRLTRSSAAPSIRRTVRSPTGYRDQYYFSDFIGQFIARLDAANGNAVYTFARLSAQPVDLLVGIDGALYVLTRAGITRISAP